MAAPLSTSNKKIKVHYSYGGKIIYRGGRLRYAGGTNGILEVDRCITYTELVVKLWDTGLPSMSMRCTLPGEDLNLLIHIMSDDDLAFVLEQYDAYGEDMKIRAVLDDPTILTNKPLITKFDVDALLGCKVL